MRALYWVFIGWWWVPLFSWWVKPIYRKYAPDRKTRDEANWLAIARQRAGLPAVDDVPQRVPEGWPTFPPTNGTTDDIEVALYYAGVWWRAFRLAEERGLPAEEVARFKSIGKHWYAERDRLQSAP